MISCSQGQDRVYGANGGDWCSYHSTNFRADEPHTSWAGSGIARGSCRPVVRIERSPRDAHPAHISCGMKGSVSPRSNPRIRSSLSEIRTWQGPECRHQEVRRPATVVRHPLLVKSSQVVRHGASNMPERVAFRPHELGPSTISRTHALAGPGHELSLIHDVFGRPWPCPPPTLDKPHLQSPQPLASRLPVQPGRFLPTETEIQDRKTGYELRNP
jgi:hypothetical protein